MTAIADSGPLIVLAKIGLLSLLPRLYQTVIIPQAVYQETVIEGERRGHDDARIIAMAVADGALTLAGTAGDGDEPPA